MDGSLGLLKGLIYYLPKDVFKKAAVVKENGIAW